MTIIFATEASFKQICDCEILIRTRANFKISEYVFKTGELQSGLISVFFHLHILRETVFLSAFDIYGSLI